MTVAVAVITECGSVTDLMSLTTYVIVVFIVLANLVRRPLQNKLKALLLHIGLQ